MSFIEKLKTSSETYLRFVKTFTFMGKTFTYKKHIGRGESTVTKEKYLAENLDEIINSELEFKKQFLKHLNKKFAYTDVIPLKIEEKSIKINNLKEIKNKDNEIEIDFAIKFIFNSNNIEGSKIPESVVKNIIEKRKLSYKDENEVREALNSIEAFRYLKNFKFNLESIKRLYYILTNGLIMEDGNVYPRGFKKENIVVGNYETTQPRDVEKELKKLLEWYKKNKKKIHPLILAFDFHLRYESIHPFRNGNGRTGRLILNKILMQNGYPPMIVYKDNKISYFNAIAKAREGNYKKYYQFMLEQMNKSYDYLLNVIKKY